VTNLRRRDAHTGYARRWSRVWYWPIPPGTYVDPQLIEAYLREEATLGESPPRSQASPPTP
jgi:hypothetical protein